jgi:hypothetical protein
LLAIDPPGGFPTDHSNCRNVHRVADLLGRVPPPLPAGTFAVSCRTIPGRCLARPALISESMGGPSCAPRSRIRDADLYGRGLKKFFGHRLVLQFFSATPWEGALRKLFCVT